MSKHNNNLSSSSSAKCRCGRKITLGEEKCGVNPIGYECPNCSHRRYTKPLSKEDYYRQLLCVFTN